jgi:hypothetical protein
MAKLKWFTSEYSGLITFFGVILVLLINTASAAYIISSVQTTQKTQTETLSNVVINLGKVAEQVKLLTEWKDDMENEHAQLMIKNKLPPYKWQQIQNEAQSGMKSFPK